MARASNVYIVTDGRNGGPVAAFTVKHECKTWSGKLAGMSRRGLFVTRLPDGGRQDIAIWPLDEFI